MKLLGRSCAIVALAFGFGAPSLAHKQAARQPDPLAQMQANHVFISTGDFAGTVAWYRDILGFEITRQWQVPLDGSVLVDVAYMERNGFLLEIAGTPAPFQPRRNPPDVFAALSDRGIGHLAFLVPDVDAVADSLATKGVEIVLPPTDIEPAERRVAFVRDNNGNLIEFVTPLGDYLPGPAG